ncbi:MAG TPA: Spy/CpxP family protein refolding chaperone [Xanthobacteraceae bacterium]|nr:Spy/CpxP family protein refolding chaperone [Xanthobacteraceae bacterium]
MRKIGAYLTIVALGAVALAAPPAAAFGLQLGPFHLGVPLFAPHWRHHRPLYMRGSANELARSAQGPASALIYPNLALPPIVQTIFFPADPSPWPFGYERIFSTAFNKMPASEDQRLCQPSFNVDTTVQRLAAATAPTPEQMQLLQKLGGALGAAAGFLAKACPTEIPAQPVARLQLMDSQIEELSMAIDIIRPPLQDFEQALSNEQSAKLTPAAADGDKASDAAAACDGLDDAIDWSVGEIDKSVRPTQAQRNDLSDVKAAFAKAASDLKAHCRAAQPSTALGRLETIESRLDATWRSVLSIQVALTDFQTKLNSEQKNRFDRMNFAAAR